MTWFEIFKVGKWNGLRYRKSDLEQMVENFKKGVLRVPLIIGHNDWSGEKPAHGWVSDLKLSGSKLLAKVDKVSEELKKAVNDRIYPERSIEVWGEYNGNQNVLGAVAFLGGSNPAVNGMAEFQFAKKRGKSPRTHTFKMGGGIPLKAKFKKKIGDAFEASLSEAQAKAVKGAIAKFKKKYDLTDEAETEIVEAIETSLEEVEAPADLIEEIIAAAEEIIQEELDEETNPDGEGGSFRRKPSGETNAFAQENQELRERVQRLEVERGVERCQTFAERMLNEKRITPAVFNGGMVGFMASLSTEAKYRFGKTKESQLDYFMGLIKALPVNGEMFTVVDKDGERDGESVPGSIAAFAKKHGLDPKLFMDNLRKD